MYFLYPYNGIKTFAGSARKYNMTWTYNCNYNLILSNRDKYDKEIQTLRRDSARNPLATYIVILFPVLLVVAENAII